MVIWIIKWEGCRVRRLQLLIILTSMQKVAEKLQEPRRQSVYLVCFRLFFFFFLKYSLNPFSVIPFDKILQKQRVSV